MTYEETVNYLFTSAPLFQHIGAGAYKEGLSNTHALDARLGHPHRKFKTIHVAGTNGKGSCSHTLAAILQSAGLRVGLFTSPHLVDFRERIRVDGQMISKQWVTDFVATHRSFFEPLHPSFFELTTAMAFAYFAEREVDVAVIEVGLGGRLDCTNIITPELSLITNISLDHVAFLGDTLAKIAVEKAGIIKEGVPVVVGEATPETRPIFAERARLAHASIAWAEEDGEVLEWKINDDGAICYTTRTYGEIKGQLTGLCQTANTRTILCAVRRLIAGGWNIRPENVRAGFAHVCETTGLMGRWQMLRKEPVVVCDTGHNVGGLQWTARQLRQTGKPLRIVFGMAGDKDVDGALALMPSSATYYFCQASVSRAMPHGELKAVAARHGLRGGSFGSVREAYRQALEDADEGDFVFVGGSSFVVADLLADFQE